MTAGFYEHFASPPPLRYYNFPFTVKPTSKFSYVTCILETSPMNIPIRSFQISFKTCHDKVERNTRNTKFKVCYARLGKMEKAKKRGGMKKKLQDWVDGNVQKLVRR